MVIDIRGIAGDRLLRAHVRKQMSRALARLPVTPLGAQVLIAVATTGRSGISRVALGSVAEAVFRKAPVAVVLFHPGRRGAD